MMSSSLPNKNSPLIIVGPCSLESEHLANEVTKWAMDYPQIYLRAALFKPRTHPDSFQGLGLEGLPVMQAMIKAKAKCVTEVLSVEQAEAVWEMAHGLQIGARNMQNFELLKNIGHLFQKKQLQAPSHRRPFVLLKRGFANGLEEWMAAALYLERYGVPSEQIVLCERGSRNTTGGVTLDLGLALQAKYTGRYRVIVDPSHGSKNASLVIPLAKAAMAAGLDGLMIEAHPRPETSLSDAAQTISLEKLSLFLSQYRPLQEISI